MQNGAVRDEKQALAAYCNPPVNTAAVMQNQNQIITGRFVSRLQPQSFGIRFYRLINFALFVIGPCQLVMRINAGGLDAYRLLVLSDNFVNISQPA